MDWKRYSLPIIAVGVAFLFSCGGGGGVEDPNHFGDPNGNQGVVGDILTPPNPADVPQTGTYSGVLGSAPLGTDPAYGVQEASDTIETNLISGTSSVRGTSQEDRIFWVAIVERDGTPIEGQAVPPLSEGDDIDLYMRYQVYESELTVARQWYIEAAGLDYIEPGVAHPQSGIYEAIFHFTIPFGSAGLEAIFNGGIGASRATSVFVADDLSVFSELPFEIVEIPTYTTSYPPETDDDNDQQGGGGGCLPEFITVTFNGNSVDVVSEKDLSNVVLVFEDGEHYKYDDLNQGTIGTFSGTTPEGVVINTGTIVTVYVKSGCNFSGEGPGYGELFEVNIDPETGLPYTETMNMAQFAWEDLITSGDYDYNDFVGRMNATETYLDGGVNADSLVQVTMVVKAVARAAGYDADWQFNVGAAFPSNRVICYVDQFKVDGTRHGDQRIYISTGGMSIPVFTPIRDALPRPIGGSYATNGIPDTQFVDGDFALITILLEDAMADGTFTPAPYNPELRVLPNGADGTGIYIIPMWRQPGDIEDEYGNNYLDSAGRPLAFIVPDTYAWPLEGVHVNQVYTGFDSWVTWIGNSVGDNPFVPQNPEWWDVTPTNGSNRYSPTGDVEVFNMILFN